MDPHGKIALVTGAAHRVGRAILLALAASGADVVLHYHDATREAEETAAQARALGQRVFPIQADLSQVAEIERLFTELKRAFGRLDILVNSAAIMEAADVLEVGESDWNRTIDLNLRAPFFCAQQAARLMPRGGVIVNIADVAGMQPWARYPLHSVSKAGVIMLTHVLAKALAPRIRVNAIAPGPVARPERMDEARWATVTRKLPLQQAGTPDDIARAVLYFVREEYVTGVVLPVDGGAHLA